jgi:PmbA protein
MDTNHQNLIAQLLDAAQTAGADGADAMLARGQSNSISLRLGKVEASERSEDFDIGLRVFIGQRTASISTSQLDPENIKNLAERAVAMAKLAPEDPYVRLATDAEIAKSIPDLDMFDETMPIANIFAKEPHAPKMPPCLIKASKHLMAPMPAIALSMF